MVNFGSSGSKLIRKNKQPVLIRKFKGGIDFNTRVNLIEMTLPLKRIDPETGEPADYQSEHYLHIEELIAMYRALSRKVPPRNHKDVCEIINLRRQVSRITDKHERLKENNKELRRQVSRTTDKHARLKESNVQLRQQL